MRRLLIPILALALGTPALSFAQGKGSVPLAQQAEARSLGEEGLKLFAAGKWAEAQAAFDRAEALYHAPTLVLYGARCRRNQGKLLEARALYEKVVAEAVDKDATEAFRRAQAQAREELAAVRGRIARVTVVAAAGARVTIDGAGVEASELARGKEVDPGEHTVVAEGGGGEPVRRTVTLKDGEAANVSLVVSAPVPVVESRRGLVVPAGIALGVGGVGAVVGVVAGALTMAKISEIKARCTPEDGEGNRHCPASDKPKAETAQTLKTVSTVGFVAGGAGLVAGTVLLLVRPGAAKRNERAGVRVDIGLGSVSLEGRF